MSRRRLSTRRLTVLGIVTAWLAATAAPAQVDGEPVSPPSVIVEIAEQPDTLVTLLDWVNARRRALDHQPIEPNQDVLDLAQALADEITIRAAVSQDALEPDRLLEALRSRQYPAVRVVVGQAVAGGSWASVIEQWAAADPATFDRLSHPELSHLALGIGDVRGTPLYVVLGAAPADLALERRTVALRDEPESVRAAVLEHVNRARKADGLRPLIARRLLDRVAQGYAEDMLERGFYGHSSPEGQTVLDRVRHTGYRPLRVGENIASGQTSAEQVMDGWLASPDHRANILHEAFRELGVGIAAGRGPDDRYRVYWVQVFADPR